MPGSGLLASTASTYQGDWMQGSGVIGLQTISTFSPHGADHSFIQTQTIIDTTSKVRPLPKLK